MGTLIPAVSYIYENDGQKIYAREVGSTHRRVIGETMQGVYQQRADDHLWSQIRRASDHNPALKDALDQVLVIYNLSHRDG